VTSRWRVRRNRCGSSSPSSGRRTGVDASGSIPLTFADVGIEAFHLGFVGVEDQGSVEFLLHLTI